MFQKIEAFLKSEEQKLEAFLSKEEKVILDHAPQITAVMGKIKAFFDNKNVQGIEDVLLGTGVEKAVTAAIDWAITKWTNGSAIMQDIANAVSTEQKITIFITDLFKYDPEIAHMKIGDIAALALKYIGDKEGTTISVNTVTRLIEAQVAELQKA